MSHYFTNEVVEDRPDSFTFSFRDKEFTLHTNAGVFSKDKFDEGSKILVDTILNHEQNHDRVLDLGCGIGPIGIILASYWKESTFTFIDVNQRAIELAKQNIQKYHVDANVLCRDGVDEKEYDCIVLNPPIRTGKQVIYGLFDQSMEHLSQDGCFWIVMRKQHGANSAMTYLQEKGFEVERITRDKGYWVMRIKKGH